VIDYLVERMRAGGCTTLRIVTRPEKEDVVAQARRIAGSGDDTDDLHVPAILAALPSRPERSL
jgi:hypothetical protein